MFYCIPLRDFIYQVDQYFEDKYTNQKERDSYYWDFIAFLIEDYQILEILHFYWNHPFYPTMNLQDIQAQIQSNLAVMAYDEIDMVETSEYYQNLKKLSEILVLYIFQYLQVQKLPFYGLFKGHHLSSTLNHYNSFLYLEYLPFKDFILTSNGSTPYETYEDFPF